MNEGPSSKGDSLSLEATKEADLRNRSKEVDKKLSTLEALEKHRTRSKFTVWALAVPPLGLGLLFLSRGTLTGALQLGMIAVLLFGVSWITGRFSKRSVGKRESEVEKLTGPPQ
jgi:hypothetical protein